ncbi:hypothetical protein A3A79_02040 [Candidatus Gottesmanbacteria bacterium RIFCSPLOWO2_01_FULL_43_11b]|uniref:Membrane protein 6-pyruvoyl-tetrahydropterin synthase-related domain-containing protein n=1 Tax=Candidatus Gottesmanbacteria bacterium RIFCSPLOWO2_01_FULL_43_11b TaxID=1798392 RepID=A0A1F6AH01_9BACT|nr:MAG: hypothetical protein A3A79_02040 [Candidatus Gottesmanbacteria bacterium RIFCSPLOWO2_01_FULL_43_11b]
MKDNKRKVSQNFSRAIIRVSEGVSTKKFWANFVGFALLLFSIGFNLWIYRLEPTAKVDPNDNHFQFALVDRTNQIFDFAPKNCSKKLSFVICHLSFLIDHWVPNWAEGYNLPYYYSHIPQIAIVAFWRSLHIGSLFQFYHWVIYFLLSLFPLSLFLALRITGLSWITAGVGALIGSQISTDGFYGLDPASFLWRGYGLSSQLFAMVFLPLAIAFALRGKVIPTILTLAATTAGHLGIGIIAFISVGIVGFRKVLWIWVGAGLLLAYWIIPAYLHNNYHNFSVWDPIWKFDSYGAKEVITRLFNGNLFDFGRFPILTILVLVGLFVNRNFAILFIFWVLMYFGRTTWGSLIDLVPFLKEFHQSRFIVGIHLAGLFLIPIGFQFLFQKLKNIFLVIPIIILFIFMIYPQTTRYAKHNDFLINRGNADYQKVEDDVDSLFLNLKSYLSARPGRVFAGRGGSWGRDFRVAETPYYMFLSTHGISTVLWMPETWSPSSDTEQFFSENQPKDYVLFNIRYVVAPPNQQPQSFWKLLKESPTWKLYEVETEGYISSGVRPAIVSSSKENFINLVHLWIQSDYHKQGLYPQLIFDKDYPKNYGLPNFRMLDEVTYKVPDGSTHNLFSEVPSYMLSVDSYQLPKILSQESDSDMVFKAKVEVKEDCKECIVILKQTFHPSWRATIDGKPVEPITAFPFFTAVKLESAGTHEVIFSYQPSGIKIALLIVSVISLGALFALTSTGQNQ